MYRFLVTNEITISDYKKVIRIVIGKGDQAVTLVVHQHLVDALSRVPRRRCVETTEGITLTPDGDYLNKPQIWHYFVHWIYFNEFTSQGDKQTPGYPELLDLYFLAEEYSITVLKNVLIDRLIQESFISPVPSGMSYEIYLYTLEDQLRRLWVDFYIWDVEEAIVQAELKSYDMHPGFVRDLAAAQAELLRSNEAIYKVSPPYKKDSIAYHIPDSVTGICCCRTQFEGNKYKHRRDYIREETNMGYTLAGAKRKVKDLEDQVLERPKPPKKRKLVRGLRNGETQA